MSRQHLNLFDPALKPQKEWLSLANVVLATVIVLMLLMVLGSWGRYQEGVELARLKSQERQLKVTQEQLVELAAMQASRRTDPGLEKDLANLKLLLGQKQQVLALLDSGVVGQSEGFSTLMEALARQVPEGLWLQGFDVQSGNRAMVLHGGMIAEPLLPQFVLALNQEPHLKGKYFSTLLVTPVQHATSAPGAGSAVEPTDYLQFSLKGIDADAPAMSGGAQ